MFYFPIKCSTQEATEIGEFVCLDELEVVSYGLLLPLLLRENMELEYDNSLYTLITSHWKTLDCNRELVLPHHNRIYED